MEEKIKELLYQYRKSTDEVAHLRSQLTLTEDQNEKLQTDLNKVTNKYSRAQLILEELKKEKNEYEDCKESLQVSLKEVKKIERQLVLKEKENGNLYSQIEKLKSEVCVWKLNFCNLPSDFRKNCLRKNYQDIHMTN